MTGARLVLEPALTLAATIFVHWFVLPNAVFTHRLNAATIQRDATSSRLRMSWCG
ncbi:MAG: hypothetical protein H0U35_08940 [Sporichthyaceae bacterium]|nr:hypothetical protein [Sporichthyaceae bacterium]